jgi:hypothetical protein
VKEEIKPKLSFSIQTGKGNPYLYNKSVNLKLVFHHMFEQSDVASALRIPIAPSSAAELGAVDLE